MNLSAHFTLEEMGGVGAPSSVQQALADTAQRMEAFRAIVGAPFKVTSGYRSAGHNADVGGSATSDHPNGRAVDGAFIGPTMFDVWKKLDAATLPAFDQIIFYPFTTGHIHFGFGTRMRRQFLVKLNETDYAPLSPELVKAFPGATVAVVSGGALLVIAAISVYLYKKGK